MDTKQQIDHYPFQSKKMALKLADVIGLCAGFPCSRARSMHDFSVEVSDFLIGLLGLPTAGENELSKTNHGCSATAQVVQSTNDQRSGTGGGSNVVFKLLKDLAHLSISK